MKHWFNLYLLLKSIIFFSSEKIKSKKVNQNHILYH